MEGNRRGPMDAIRNRDDDQPLIDPTTGIRKPDSQRMDQLIGGPDHDLDDDEEMSDMSH